MERKYEVIIVGGGITGASLLFTLSRYTDVRSILLLEKYDDFAALNSNSTNNAQTLHFGDVETNYSLETAKKTKMAAQRIVEYAKLSRRNDFVKHCQKMVLGVGEDEAERLRKTYSSGIRKIFPKLRMIEKGEIGRLEPNITKKRDKDEELLALLSDNGKMVDFGKLTHSFAKDAKIAKDKKIDMLFNSRVRKITRKHGEYVIITDNNIFIADFVVFAAGAYSLFFAKSLGYDQNLSILSVGGNFYTAPKVLRGKVYRVQHGGIPFAAIHGDPDITNPHITRFGPTVSLELELERRHRETIPDYLRTFDFDIPTALSLERILLNRDIRRIIAKNVLYDIPLIGRYEFLKREAGLIVPSLRYSSIHLDKHMGGIRPQIIDENKKTFVVGGAKMHGEAAIFNITPSPGASSCLQSALEDTIDITKHLDRHFNKKRYEKELGRIRS